MHSTMNTFLPILYASVSLLAFTSAAPMPWTDPTVCPAGQGYYQKCAANGFNGCCTTDACSRSWCPDYSPGTYTPVEKTSPLPQPEPQPLPTAVTCDSQLPSASKSNYYVCANNGFRGYCSTDPCSQPWCADYIKDTCDPVEVVVDPPKPTDDGAEPVTKSTPPPTSPAVKLYYLCAYNGFNGDCSVDPCALAWCPDYTFGTYEVPV